MTDEDDATFMRELEADRATARHLAADILEQAIGVGRVSEATIERLQTQSDRVCGEYYLLIRELRFFAQ